MDEIDSPPSSIPPEIPVNEELPTSSRYSAVLLFMKQKRTIFFAVVVFLLILAPGVYVIAQSNSSKTPTPTITQKVTPTQAPSPTIKSIQKKVVAPTGATPLPTVKPTNSTTSSQSSSNQTPTPTNTPTPPSAPTTGTINGGYYDFATRAGLTDSRFAVNAIGSEAYYPNGDQPTFTLNNVKPGHYTIDIDYDYSKYNPHSVTCGNCAVTSTQSTQIQIDLKAGDNVHIQWNFNPK